jgi:hypothetical protein
VQSSARRSIQFPSADRSDKPDIPLHFSYLVAALEKDVSYGMGAFSARPANPGYAAYIYFTTDTHLAFWWDGSNWYAIGTSDVVPATLVDAKGDIVVALGDNTPARLPVGSNNQVLSADNTTPTGLKWILNQVLDLVSAKGDVLAGTGTDALGRVAVGADGTALIADSAQSAGVRFGPPVITTVTPVFLGADVGYNALTAILSISIPAGTWYVHGRVTVSIDADNRSCAARLWDGTTIFASASASTGGVGNIPMVWTLPLDAIVTLASTTTVTISCQGSGAGTAKAGTTPTTANKATSIHALRIG